MKMNIENLKISGDVSNDAKVLKRFSKDASSYKILPSIVVSPKTEEDIQKAVFFARENGIPLTSRSGGSGLSGAAVGSGMIVNFKKFFNRVSQVGKNTVVQSGAVLDHFLKQMSEKKLMIPSIPSSSALCALGGNVGTRSTGPRTARYGTIDDFIISLRFITSKGEIVDTEKELPQYLKSGIEKIRAAFLADPESQQIVASRPYIAGGYNLAALAKYRDANKIAAHLMAGSVGTLGIVTEIRLKLIPYTPSQGTFVAHFRNWDDFSDAAVQVKKLNPAALEFADASCAERVSGRILTESDKNLAAIMIAEFDESEERAEAGKSILQKYDLSAFYEVPAAGKEEAQLWNERKQILPSLWKYAREKDWFLPSIIDDIAIHLKYLKHVRAEIAELMKRTGHEISFFGHLGFGSIHARPYFKLNSENLTEEIVAISQATFNILQKYQGTLVGEHNAGRSRSIYLVDELGPAFKYMEMIKKLFDADDLLNPETVFNTRPIYENMEFAN